MPSVDLMTSAIGIRDGVGEERGREGTSEALRLCELFPPTAPLLNVDQFCLVSV